MKIKNMITNVIIGILCLVLLVASFAFVKELSYYGNSYTIEEDSFLYALKDEDYVRLVEYWKRNEAAGVRVTENLGECYAVAEYYEAASLYKAYKQMGNKAQTALYKGKMEDAVSRMGALSYTGKNINKRLGLEE